MEQHFESEKNFDKKSIQLVLNKAQFTAWRMFKSARKYIHAYPYAFILSVL